MNKTFPTIPTEQPLRIAFFGTPDFAAICLQKLHTSRNEIVAVITAPDKKSGRGQRMHHSPVKSAASQLNLPVLQPQNLKDPSFAAIFKELDCDLAIVVAFRMLPKAIWSAPRFGSINLHASLLPQLRGAAPIQWAIRHKLLETGVTTFSLQHAIDTGDILLQESVAIEPTETAGTLHDKLLQTGSTLIIETIEKLTQGNLRPVAQADLLLSRPLLEAPKLNRENCLIKWSQSTDNVLHMIRSLNPYPKSWCTTPTGDLKVISAQPTELDIKLQEAGTAIIHRNRLFIACSDGWIELLKIVPNGKKPMEARAWINGLQPSQRQSLGIWN
jgi:methionyl-tRNA formyltransferase